MRLKCTSVDRLERRVSELSDEQLLALYDHKMWGFVTVQKRLESLLQGNLYLLLCDRIKMVTGKDVYTIPDFLESLPEKHMKITVRHTLMQVEIMTILVAMHKRGIKIPT